MEILWPEGTTNWYKFVLHVAALDMRGGGEWLNLVGSLGGLLWVKLDDQGRKMQIVGLKPQFARLVER